MNPNLQKISDFLRQNEQLSVEERASLAKAVKDTESEMAITAFKFDRTEKVKRTTAILLEETIEELKKKREAVEGQNKELEIEFSLERVRTVAMGMRKPGDLLSICEILFAELHNMGFGELRNAMINIHNDEKGSFLNYDFSESAGATVTTILYNSHPATKNLVKQVRSATDAFAEFVINGDELDQWREYRKSMGEMDDPKLHNIRQLSYYFFSIGTGAIGISTYEPVSEEKRDVLKRFRNVFELAYRRYIDVTQAEAQAREAQIQLALERVRARTMAMQRSDEMAETAAILFEQFFALGEKPERMAIEIVNEEEHVFEIWATEHGGKQFNSVIKTSLEEPYVMQKMYRAWKEQNKSITIDLQGNELEAYFQFLKKMKLPVDRKIFGNRRVQNVATFSRGILTIITPEPRPRETIDILERFAKVFDGTYTRFLDLQKAEEQAREAQIEAALERVRSRSLAMHKSDELQEVVNTVQASLVELGVKMDSANFNILYEGSRDMDLWIANIYSQRIHVPYLDLKPVRDMMDARDHGITSLQVACTQEQKNLFWKDAFEKTGFSVASTERKKFILESKCWTVLWALAKHCGIQLNSYSRDSYTEEEVEITKRFANVFEQAYVRFLDLQKAEAQAREAIIESALERVRSKTMAMHNSQDVGDTVSTLLDELVKLGVETNRCGILIYSDKMTAEVWTAKSNPEGKSTLTMGQLDLAVHPLLSGIYQAWKNKEPLFTYPMVGKDLIAYYEAINETKYYPTSFELSTLPSKEFHSDFYFPEGSIFAFTAVPIPPVATIIFKRFAGVFGQTYRRYLDLQKSEANAIEALRRSSLDRVRAETASMRTTDDLERITPLIWNELTTLGVSFTRCGVFIMDQPQEQIHTFLSTPDGRAIAAFHLPYDTAQTTFQNLVEYWQKKQIYKEHWDEAAFINWTRNLVKSGAIEPTEKYVTGDHPTNLDLHFIPFLQGMLYVGNDKPLSEDELHLVQNLADAFSTAYARYEDFNKLESAKTQIEKTLVDLKMAQAQLVQSEKMASLGELTAGIAHEIQNPLNFVNNFSEVSVELVGEMNEELAAGNWQLAAEIANDVRQNLEKINLHGKRAGDIVKGMLQHSRSSSGVKEPTDINALADEYLRLAYHGLRAKDKSFNATMKTDFDESIGKINIIPQDIGRVILNLITNAFYACNIGKSTKVETQHAASLQPPSPQSPPDYNPTVTVSTKNRGDCIEISVRDNGPGIPSNILAKIFQPFFTTKPTGEGTGLGLSMSYDIVKAHGGELKVETNEGEGSTFSIELPNQHT